LDTTRRQTGPAPIIVDLGSKKRKAVKRLKRGEGPLIEEVDEVLGQVRAELGAEAKDALVVPVILVYKRKARRRSRSLAGLL
jgi:hypothetical protein